MNILIAGGPGSFTDSIIQKIRKEGHRIYLLSGQKNSLAKYEHVFERYDFPYDSTVVKTIFESVNPDVTLCLGAYDPNFDMNVADSALRLTSCVTNLLMAYATLRHGRFIFLSSERVYNDSHADLIDEDTPTDAEDAAGLVLSQLESACLQWQANLGLDIVVMRLERMTGTPRDHTEIRSLVARMTLEALEKGEITCRDHAEVSLLSGQDSLEFISSMIKCREHKYTLYNLSSQENVTERMLAEEIFKRLEKDQRFVADKGPRTIRILSNRRYDSEFGIRIFAGLEKILDDTVVYMKQHANLFMYGGRRKENVWTRINKQAGRIFHALLPYIENLILFIPFFMLNNRAVDSKYFSRLDFYVLYVLLFAIVHGQTQAVFSAVLAVAGFCFRQMYTRTGFDVVMDYNTYVWIAQLFIIGLTVGHMHDQNKQLREEAMEEKDYLSTQIKDIEQISGTNLRVKNSLETQLINQQDSLGKVYAITSSLDQYQPEEVLFYAAETLSQLMDCRDVSLYIVSNADYARIFTATSAMARSMGTSIRYREMEGLYEEIIKHKVFINKQMDDRLPMMASGVFEGERLLMIVMLWNLPWSSVTLGRANMLAVICSLIERASLRATRYLDAVKDQRHYIGSTSLLNNQAFDEIVKAYETAYGKGLTIYSLLRIEAVPDRNNAGALGDAIAAVVRSSDYVGIRDDGQIYVLLSNTTAEAASIVVKRFADRRIQCTIVEEN